LTHLPEGVHKIKNLKDIKLKGNHLQMFNIKVNLMPNVKSISLDWFCYLSC